MTKKILSLAALAILCFGTLVFAQNTNSSTTMQGNDNMSKTNMSGMHRHGRRHRRMHRRHRHMDADMKMGNKNANN
ncbi:MAG: hypothetical protein ABJC10_10780 [Acidobacteriota bacterium]